MSYQQSLEAAGARVLAFEHFGDWQGSWVALVEYQGETGWVHGWFGSCSACDAFQGEFGWDDDFESEYERERLASFGRTYLEGLMPTERVLSYYQTDSDWDSDAQDAMFWIRETVQTYEVPEWKLN